MGFAHSDFHEAIPVRGSPSNQVEVQQRQLPMKREPTIQSFDRTFVAAALSLVCASLTDSP